MINSAGLGGLSVATGPSIQVSAPLTMANGGQVSFVAPNVDIAAPVTAHAGAVSITNLLTINGGASTTLLTAAGTAGVTLEATGSIDTSGLWTNTMLDLNNTAGEGFINGGSVSIDTTQGITLAAGSVISASSGGAVVIGGTIKGGHGGNITLIADDPSVSGVPGAAVLTMGGTLQAYGVTAGGALTLAAPSVLIGDGVTTNAPGQIVLPSAFFTQGFSNYTITGYDGVTVAPGTQVNVVEPVYHFTAASYEVPTGTAPSAALSVWTPPLYIQNPLTAMLTQRASASITLNGNDLLGGGGTARDVILFNGNVNLRAGQSIAFHEGAIADTSANATVTISAPYVLLDGHTPVNVPQNSYYPTIWVWSPSKQQSTGTFFVNADLIDIEDDVRFGVNSPAQTTGSSGLTGTPIAYDYAGFANVNLTSQGDIRFTASTPTGTVALIPPQQGTATLVTSGSLTFTAEQLYPVSNSIANITAGYVGNNASLNPNSVLTIVSVNNVVPAVPYSVNGTITFDAATIDQGGVVRAPLGSVTLGTTNNTVSVNLLPGTTYNYDGVTFAPINSEIPSITRTS